MDNKTEYKAKASGITASTNAVSKLTPLGLGYVPDRTREREIRKHHLGRNLKENNRMKSILQMYINK